MVLFYSLILSTASSCAVAPPLLRCTLATTEATIEWSPVTSPRPDTNSSIDTTTILLTNELLTRMERLMMHMRQGPETLRELMADTANYARVPHVVGPFVGANVGTATTSRRDTVFDLGAAAARIPAVAAAFQGARLKPSQYLAFAKALLSAESTDTMQVLLIGMLDTYVGPTDTNNTIWRNVRFLRTHRSAIDTLGIPLPASRLRLNGGRITHFLDTTALARHVVRFQSPIDTLDATDPFPLHGFLDSTEAPGSVAGPPLRVLFIGNSLTYFNAMPRMFSHIAAPALRRRVVVGMVTLPGASPLMLWATTDVSQVIVDLPWDVVVVQLRPNGANTHAMFMHYGRLYTQAILAHHAKPILWTQWAGLETEPDAQQQLNATLDSAAAQAGATVAPIPEAWAAVQRADAGLWQSLFYPNAGDHPSALGSYLGSLVLYRTITGQSPVGLTRAIGTDAPVSDSTARVLQQAASSAKAAFPSF